MMGYESTHCKNLKQKECGPDAVHALYSRRKLDLVNDLVDPICIISNANHILYKKLGMFLDEETKAYFAMIGRATAKSRILVEELKNESCMHE